MSLRGPRSSRKLNVKPAGIFPMCAPQQCPCRIHESVHYICVTLWGSLAGQGLAELATNVGPEMEGIERLFHRAPVIAWQPPDPAQCALYSGLVFLLWIRVFEAIEKSRSIGEGISLSLDVTRLRGLHQHQQSEIAIFSSLLRATATDGTKSCALSATPVKPSACDSKSWIVL